MLYMVPTGDYRPPPTAVNLTPNTGAEALPIGPATRTVIGMIWLRRALTIPLWLVLFLLLFVTLVVFRINSTFLNPDYYPEQLRDASLFEFALNDVLISVLDEARQIEIDPIEDAQSDINVEENPLVLSGLTTEDIVASVNRAVPPEWIQETVEQVFDEFGHYLTGDRDDFSITIVAGDRVVAIIDEFKSLTRKADAYNLLFEQAIEPAVAKAVEKQLPLNMTVDPSQLVASIRKIADPDWVQTTVDATLDEVTPYLVAEKDGFQVTVILTDRVEIASAEIKALLREVDAYEVIYTEVATPALRKEVGNVIEIPMNETITIELTIEEVIDALRRVAPPAWVQEQAETIIDDTTAFFVGKRDDFEVDIDIRQNKLDAKSVLADIIERQVVEQVGHLPQCTEPAATNGDTEFLIPLCVPPSASLQEFLNSASVDFEEIVESAVFGPVPDSLRFGDKDIRAALQQADADENVDRLDFLRAVLKSGWNYTEVDLRNNVRKLNSDWREMGDDDPAQLVDDIRGFLSDGYTFTDQDFRELIDRESVSTNGDSILGGGSVSEQFDQARDLFGLARTLRWLLVLPLLILLVAIGFLGGRGWGGRSIWAGGALLLAAAIIFIAAGPVYNSLTDGPIETARAEVLRDTLDRSSDFPNTTALAINKGFDFGVQVADNFMGGVTGSVLMLSLIGILMIIVSVFWKEFTRTARRVQSR